MAIFSVSLFVLIGVVVDGGRAVTLRGAVEGDAEQAARVGAGQLSVQALRAGTLSITSEAAQSAAQKYLVEVGETGTVTVIGDRVTVTATATEPTAILSLVGIDRIDVSATATATDVGGVAQGDQ